MLKKCHCISLVSRENVVVVALTIFDRMTEKDFWDIIAKTFKIV